MSVKAHIATCNDNSIKSSESQVDLCMHGGHRPSKKSGFGFPSDLKSIEMEADDR